MSLRTIGKVIMMPDFVGNQWVDVACSVPIETELRARELAQQIADWVSSDYDIFKHSDTHHDKIMGDEVKVRMQTRDTYIVSMDYKVTLPILAAFQYCGNLALAYSDSVDRIMVGMRLKNTFVIRVKRS